jgi:GNAT superfamily N-acetyltransferase
MQIEIIQLDNIISLEIFLNSCGSSLDTFRYFAKRPLTVITNHLTTLLGFDEHHFPVAYGHLDQENGRVWLGICVAEGHQNKGFGHQMMRKLLQSANKLHLKSIALTVDADNKNAIRMYEHFGFEVKNQTAKTILYGLAL